MREWPSIVPAESEDYYLVVNHLAGSAQRSQRPIFAALAMKPPSLIS
jgi:hypothetical protein